VVARSQRQRLLEGMLTVASRGGYNAATVAQVIAAAGVSRPTFYEHFADKEDCFLAAVAGIREELLADVRTALAAAPPERGVAVALGALVSFASSEPTTARLLLGEPLAGGPRALDARDEMLTALAQIVDAASHRVQPGAVLPDLPSRVLLGAVTRMLAVRLARGETALDGMLDELLAWLESYARPISEHRWRRMKTLAPPARSPFLPHAPLRAPPTHARTHARMGRDRLAEEHRQRIVFATAEIVRRDGYAAATVTDIARLAGVDTRAFYRAFTDKQQAFAAVTDVLFRHLMAVSAGAFVIGESWPERVWEAMRALTQCLEQNPTLAQVALVEGHAAAPDAICRIQDLACAFTIFLEEGYRYEPKRGCPSELALEATATTVLALCYQQGRPARSTANLSGLLGQISFICLAPFLGAAETDAFLKRRTRTGSERTRWLPHTRPMRPRRRELAC
jgi:AcrR family transcriptional regulator